MIWDKMLNLWNLIEELKIQLVKLKLNLIKLTKFQSKFIESDKKIYLNQNQLKYVQ